MSLASDLDDFGRAMDTLVRLLAQRRWKDEDEMVAWIRATLRVRAGQN